MNFETLEFLDAPHNHLRDRDGCVLDNNFIHPAKVALLIKQAKAHDQLVAALKVAHEYLGHTGAAPNELFLKANHAVSAALDAAGAT